MNNFEIKNKDNEIIAKAFLFFDYKNKKYKNKKEFIDLLIKKAQKIPSIGCAGFKSKKELEKHLSLSVFGREKFNGIPRTNFNERKIHEIIENTVRKCHGSTKSSFNYLFVFPNFNRFKKERMNGIGGFCSQKDTILIDINPVKGWQEVLKITLCHEFSHSLAAKFINPQNWTLLEALVYEGIADNFAERLTGKAALWTAALSKNECIAFFPKIKKFFSTNNQKTYRQVFFGNRKKKYPLWGGYSIGYQMIKSYLKTHSGFNWDDILTIDPKKILEESIFGGR